MKHLVHFFEWLFCYRTNPVFPALFVIGSVLTVVVLMIVAFVTEPWLGMALSGLLFFGVPFIGYRMAIAEERDE